MHLHKFCTFVPKIRLEMMNTLEIWLLGAALAMDCFSVSIASGAILRNFRWKTILTMAFFFGLFQAMMPCLGWMLTSHFQDWLEAFDHWIAFGLLLYLGLNMIRESFQDEGEKNFDPSRMKVIITLAIATSIDALAVGISFVCTGYQRWLQLLFPVSVIGITSFLFSVGGNVLGVLFGRKYDFKPELIGGIVLICIGIKILLTHLYDI